MHFPIFSLKLKGSRDITGQRHLLCYVLPQIHIYGKVTFQKDLTRILAQYDQLFYPQQLKIFAYLFFDF